MEYRFDYNEFPNSFFHVFHSHQLLYPIIINLCFDNIVRFIIHQLQFHNNYNIKICGEFLNLCLIFGCHSQMDCVIVCGTHNGKT